MALVKSKFEPIEVVGYKLVNLLVVDEVRETLSYRWCSVPNYDHNDDDYEPMGSDGWEAPAPF